MKKSFLLLAALLVGSLAHAQDYWKEVSSPTRKDLLSISFGTAATGYIGGRDSTLLKTTDGGKTWNALPHTGLNYTSLLHDILYLKFVSATVGYAIVSSTDDRSFGGQLYKTTDGGTTWAPASAFTGSAYHAYFFDENNGFLLGVTPFASTLISKLGSGTWGTPQHLFPGTSNYTHAIDCFSTTTGIIGGDRGYVYRTFNGGATWDTVKTNIDTAINALVYVNENTIVAATSDRSSAIIISKDKGASWIFDGASATFFYPDMKAMAVSKRDSLIIVGKSATTGKGIVYYFTPSTRWMDIETEEQWLNDVTMRDDAVGYIVGDSGLILSNDISVLSVPVLQAGTSKVAVYPNPSNGICYTSAAEEHQVAVYDLPGRMVYSGDVPAKNHELDLRHLPEGAYLLRILDKQGAATSVQLQLK